MKLYIIRHAESIGNQNKINSLDNSPLSKTGKIQANKISKKLAKIKFSSIYTSPALRSKQTIKVISSFNRNKVKIIETNLINEKKEASSIINQERKKMPWNLIKKNRIDPNWHYEDEESFNDIKKRAIAFLKKLEKYNKDNNVLAVTHNSYIKHLVLFVLLGKDFHPNIFYKIADKMETMNSGITILERKQKYYEKKPSWYLQQWMS